MYIRSNSVVNYNGTGPVELPESVSIGSSVILVSGGLNLSGVSTFTSINATNISSSPSTTINASRFTGDGSQITGLTTISSSRIIALKYIFADPPLRA
jgi:hypothetical protein